MKYYSPYKDNPYGNLKGDKKDFLFQVIFQEFKVIKSDNGFVFYGKPEGIVGVQAAFGSSLPKDLGHIEIPIYFDDYAIKQSTGKKDANDKWIYEEFKFKASAFEKYLVGHIKDNPEKWTQDGKSLKGTITFLPDMQFGVMSNDEKYTSFLRSVSAELFPESGTLPVYPLKDANGYKKNAYSKGVSIEEKITFLKRELGSLSDLSEDEVKVQPIGVLMGAVIPICKTMEVPIETYFDLLGKIIS